MKLYGYWRSSAAYRVRIALNYKGLKAEQLSVHLVKDGGEQHKADYAKLNPQELVPAFIDTDAEGNEDKFILSQSLAIVEYLDEKYPEVKLVPDSMYDRALVRSLAMSIACEVHPLNNLKVLQYLAKGLNLDDDAKSAWYHHWIHEGFAALEKQLVKYSGRYCFGDSVTLADLCLVPQVYNANRFKVDLGAYPNIVRITQNCNQLDAFIDASPENQADAS
ncbi:maleylacetoacetate isomerase [Shewanella nanhaiensis]|uniref:Maleylacetoacetate isomerase n=1 Tax=Shewanella nanhaiensis TaxID=2864872 RepID=A0ABS7E6T5_9GAMM|nr:maleylacetoacetate isomerase [Shewanella nanhaiensis]MBW8185260.1 maleylacetoacetate isomerase [Shewanella nanhaiensis]